MEESQKEPLTETKRIGIDYALCETDTELVLQTCRVSVLENLHLAPKLKKLCLISNEIENIENLEPLSETLEHLELYQNQISKIENVSMLTNLRVLDISFNNIRKIENLESLHNLEKLYLSSNKITEIQGLENLKKLELLELGSNRIREVKGIDSLTNLRELWLGKNKITQVLALPHLPKLERLSIQSNRLDSWNMSIFEMCPNLIELYLSHNQLPDIPKEMEMLKHLQILDLGQNIIKNIHHVEALSEIQDLWLNNNLIERVQDIQGLKCLTKLETLYLEGNPLQMNLGPGYRQRVLEEIPHLLQLDALLIGVNVNIIQRPASLENAGNPAQSSKPIMKHSDD